MAHLTEIVHPATLAQVSDFHRLGLRARLLTLPVMVGLLLGLLWRQIGGLTALVQVIHVEAVLWVPPMRDLTQQALAQRLRTLPADLFNRVLQTILPVLQGRWAARQCTHCPMPWQTCWKWPEVKSEPPSLCARRGSASPSAIIVMGNNFHKILGVTRLPAGSVQKRHEFTESH